MIFRRGLLTVLLFVASGKTAWSASGTEGASFLDIPVGGAPAALGSAYTAQATDVYAPVWNPAGLGYLHSVEFTGTHLDYIPPVYYEHAGLVVPVGSPDENGSRRGGLGASIQYLGTGSLDARDDQGNSIGSFTSAFAAYSLAYGERITDTISLGATAKLITEKISDASASAYAADFGLLYKPSAKFSLGAVVANIGSAIKFVDQSDPLPLAGRLGATYQLYPEWDISAESVYRETGLISGSFGLEWRCGEYLSFRGGYNTAHTKELGGGSGFTAGVGFFFWGQEFSYAWVPMGDLGQTNYFSLVFRWDTKARPERPRLKKAEDDESFGDRRGDDFRPPDETRYENIYDFLNENEKKSIK
jgi:hypothetical protein